MRTPAETQNYLTYKLNGITYVPHYTKECYVSPGCMQDIGILDEQGDKFYVSDPKKEYSAHELEKAGATKASRLLWPRAKFKSLRY